MLKYLTNKYNMQNIAFYFVNFKCCCKRDTKCQNNNVFK